MRGRRYSIGTPATCLRWYFYVHIDSLSSSFFACWSLGSSLFSSIYAVLRRRASTFDAETLENEQPIHQMKSYSSPHLQRLHLPAQVLQFLPVSASRFTLQLRLRSYVGISSMLHTSFVQLGFIPSFGLSSYFRPGSLS